jgi:hypothetical protein
MVAQLFYVKIGANDPIKKGVGLPISFQDKKQIDGFIFDYKEDTRVCGICLFEPIELGFEVLYYEDKVKVPDYFQKMLTTNPKCKDFWNDKFSKLNKDK